jgi:hypothetical protein
MVVFGAEEVAADAAAGELVKGAGTGGLEGVTAPA